ncbi:hypothetical protein J31TS4_46670 [Paenibacillus sp. J31TS4]|nr:hypothetical protein J31TS4_46670 [Paenibacillus sp. J31TS4]
MVGKAPSFFSGKRRASAARSRPSGSLQPPALNKPKDRTRHPIGSPVRSFGLTFFSNIRRK